MIRTRDIIGKKLTYSDTGFKIRQVETGNIYDDAIDELNSTYTYEETDIPIDVEEETQDEPTEPTS